MTTSAEQGYQRYKLWLYTIVLFYFAFFLVVNFFRLWGFGFAGGDLGAFHQAIWNMANGNGFTYSIGPPYTPDTQRLGTHFDILIILLVVPLFKLMPYPELLEFIHVMAMTFAVFPIFAACRNLGMKDRNALLWAMAYLFNPYQVYAIMFSFQDTSLAVPLMAIGLWAVTAKRFLSLILSCLGLILAKEQFGLSVAGFGLLWVLHHKQWKQGLALTLLGLIAFCIIVFLLMPYFTGEETHHLMSSGIPDAEPQFNRYQWLKAPFPEMMERFSGFMVSERSLTYYQWLFLPFLLLQFVGFIFILPAGGDLLVNILSEYDIPRRFGLYHNAPIIPCFTVAACYGTLLLSRWIKQRQQLIHAGLALAVLAGQLLCFSYIIPPVFISFKTISVPGMEWSFSEKFKDLQRYLDTLDNPPVLSTTELVVHLAQRREIHRAVTGYQPNDIFVFSLAPYAFRAVTPPYAMSAPNILHAFLQLDDWKITYWNDPYIVLERNKDAIMEKEVLLPRLNALAAYRTKMQKNMPITGEVIPGNPTP